MTPKKKRRLAFAAALVAAGAGAAVLIVGALKDNVLYFRSPTDVAMKHVHEGVAFRLGGLVEKGSVRHGAGADVHFAVTDGRSVVPADFNGVLPALFREGQGVVATGSLLPFEVYEIFRHPRPTRFLVLAVNAVILVYLARHVHRSTGGSFGIDPAEP